MNYEKLVQGILNIGEAMLQCGAEIFRVEDSLYRMYKSLLQFRLLPLLSVPVLFLRSDQRFRLEDKLPGSEVLS